MNNNSNKKNDFMNNFEPTKVSFESTDKPPVDPYDKDLSFEKIDSGFMIDINDKYFYLKCYILDAVKNIKPPYYHLDFSKFNEYTKYIEGWKENINNNHTIISGLIDRALIKAGVDRKKIKNCTLSEEHFVVHNKEFPIDALNHGSISVHDKDYEMNQCNPESDTTYKPNRNPKVEFAKAEVFYVDNTFYNMPQKSKKYKNNNTNYPYKEIYAMPEKENSYTGDKMFCEKINPITEDKYYDFTKNIKLTLFTQIYNILVDYDQTQEYDASIAGDNIKKATNNTIVDTAKNIGVIFQKTSQEKDIDLVSYGINSLNYILSNVDEKGCYQKTDITKNNDDMIPLFKIFISRYDSMIEENLGSKRPVSSPYNTMSI